MDDVSRRHSTEFNDDYLSSFVGDPGYSELCLIHLPPPERGGLEGGDGTGIVSPSRYSRPRRRPWVTVRVPDFEVGHGWDPVFRTFSAPPWLASSVAMSQSSTLVVSHSHVWSGGPSFSAHSRLSLCLSVSIPSSFLRTRTCSHVHSSTSVPTKRPK